MSDDKTCTHTASCELFPLLSLGGILLGTWLYPPVHARFFRWDKGSCG